MCYVLGKSKGGSELFWVLGFVGEIRVRVFMISICRVKGYFVNDILILLM